MHKDDFNNAAIRTEYGRYEICWVTKYAHHIFEEYIKEDRLKREGKTGPQLHNLSFIEISRSLKGDKYVVPIPTDAKPHYHVCLFKRAGHVYETYVHLVPASEQWPARCVVVTCYITNKQQYRSLFDKA